MKRAVIMGATSGMGWEVARILWEKGWTLGIAGRREEKLKQFRESCLTESGTASAERGASCVQNGGTLIKFPGGIAQKLEYEAIDIEKENAPQLLFQLIDKIGGMDLYFHTSGVGWHNKELDPQIEITTCTTNVVGFTRMVTAACLYFKNRQKEELSTVKMPVGHIAVITSIAGVKGLGPAPSYSATKSFDNTYIQALAQLNRNMKFTDIRPGFVDTPLLDTSKYHYPMLLDSKKVARIIVRAIEKKKRVVVIDWRYRILVFFWRLVPNFIWERLKL